MRILVAPDKFKGCLSAAEAAANIATGLRDVVPNADIQLLPVADGGDGTAAVLCGAVAGVWHECDVADAKGARVRARYCVTTDNSRAILETSEAVGLWRIAPEKRDPDAASSFGVGEMLLDAAARGVTEIVVGLGGSATNDAGVGMARALGFRFFDSHDDELVGAVSGLLNVARIVKPPRLRLPQITGAADVRNPLLGPQGSTHIFAEQKGAGAIQRAVLDAALARLADVGASELGVDAREEPGGGAAGGLGYGLVSFCGARIRSGFDLVAETIGLAAAIDAADIVITGEGRLDAQTAEGKAPAGVARLARAAGKPVYAIVGDSAGGEEIFDAVITILRPPLSATEAINRAGQLLRQRAAELASRFDRD